MIHYYISFFLSNILIRSRLLPSKNKKKISQHDVNNNYLDASDKLPLRSNSAITTWKDYRNETKHSIQFFEDQKEKINSILNLTQKRVDLLESKISSIKALSKRSSMNILTPISTYTVSDLRAPEEDNPNSKIDNYIEGKTTEEILMENLPHNDVVWSSQLSPFMTTFSKKFFDKHNVTITSHLPDKRYVKGVKGLFQRSASLAQRETTHKGLNNNIKRNTREIEHKSLQQNKMEKRFDNWIKFPMENPKTIKEFEVTSKELRYKGESILKYDKINENNKMQEKTIWALNPHEKLKEKNMVNAFFGSEITKNLHMLTQKEIFAAKTLDRNYR